MLEDLRGRCLVVVRTARPGRCFGPLVHAAFRGGPLEQRRAATWRGLGALPLAKSDTLRGAFERVVAAAEKAYGFTRDEVVAGFASYFGDPRQICVSFEDYAAGRRRGALDAVADANFWSGLSAAWTPRNAPLLEAAAERAFGPTKPAKATRASSRGAPPPSVLRCRRAAAGDWRAGVAKCIVGGALRDHEVAALLAAAREATDVDYEPVVAKDERRVAVFAAATDDELEAIAEAADALGGAPVLVARGGDLDAAREKVARLRIPAPFLDVAVDAAVADHFSLDGAWVDAGASGSYAGGAWAERRWDAPEVAVVDGLLDETLRAALLAELGGDGWDPAAAPDPRTWSRGRFFDSAGETGGHWGLRPEALARVAASDAVKRLAGAVRAWLREANGASVDVCTMPSEAMGPDIPAVAGNAPVAGEAFDFHVDADPARHPRGAWTDARGRYVNRSPGQPRWVSALAYLSPAWDDAWRAETVFRDASGAEVRVAPKPGRVVLLDQDALHAVSPPVGTDRPRYSLVLKLLLGPLGGGAAPALAPRPPRAVAAADPARTRRPRPWCLPPR